jgi:hypothetical protein
MKALRNQSLYGDNTGSNSVVDTNRINSLMIA